MILDFVFRRYYVGSLVDRGQPLAVIWINQPKFELGYA